MKKRHIISVIFCTLFHTILLAQPTANNKGMGLSSLRAQVQGVIDTSHAHIGVALMGLDFTDSLTINGHDRFPMQSVFKFPLAMMILHKVDMGELSLSQKVHIPMKYLDDDTWSPMVKDFPAQDIDLTLKDLLIYTVSKSDNNGCDALFRLAGGTKAVNEYIHSIGIPDIAIVATEAQMGKRWPVQYTNWCHPVAMLQLLQKFYEGKVLSKASNDFLMKIMIESANSANRIKKLLPPNTIVAHKTGTSDTNKKGIKAATNDVGIITLPGGRHLAIVVYVSDYPGGVDRGENMIAEIAKAAFDFFRQ